MGGQGEATAGCLPRCRSEGRQSWEGRASGVACLVRLGSAVWGCLWSWAADPGAGAEGCGLQGHAWEEVQGAWALAGLDLNGVLWALRTS